MTLIKGQGTGQGQLSKNWPKSKKMGHMLDAISPTDFILGTKIQPNNVLSTT